MHIRHLVLPLTLIGLAACAGASNAPPVSTEPIGPASQMPQSPNSLPLGSATAAPLDPPQGNVATTRVGPSRPAPQRTR